jgi:hypothetical protein
MTVDWQNTAGSAAAAAISGFASWLAPTPPDAKPIFVITAIGSGAAGYWISRASGFKRMSIPGRIAVAVIVILILVLLSYGYIVYYRLLTPTTAQDILGFTAFGVFFATICFALGLLQIEIFKVSPEHSSQNETN